MSFAACQWAVPQLAKNFPEAEVASLMSGRVCWLKYISFPTSLRYGSFCASLYVSSSFGVRRGRVSYLGRP